MKNFIQLINHKHMKNFKQLANSRDYMDRVVAACDEKCPVEILSKLILDNYTSVKTSVILNKSTPKELVSSYYDLLWLLCYGYKNNSFIREGYLHWNFVFK